MRGFAMLVGLAACGGGGGAGGSSDAPGSGSAGPTTPPMTYVDTIALDDTYVYLVTEPTPHSHAIARIPKAGGAFETLYSEALLALLEVRDGNVYFADGQGVEVLPAGAQAPQLLVPTSGVDRIALDASSIYIADQQRVYQAPRATGGTPMQRFQIPLQFTSSAKCFVASDGTNAFVAWRSSANGSDMPAQGGIATFPVADTAAPATELAPGAPALQPSAITVDDSGIYVIDQDGTLATLPKSGGTGTPTPLATGLVGAAEPAALALDADAAYVAIDAFVGGGTSRVVRISKADGTITELASGTNLATDAVRVDGARVYWGDNVHGLGWRDK